MTTSASFDVTITLHHEDDTYWAESVDMPGWSAGAGTRERLLELVSEGVEFEKGMGTRWVTVWSEMTPHEEVGT